MTIIVDDPAVRPRDARDTGEPAVTLHESAAGAPSEGASTAGERAWRDARRRALRSLVPVTMAALAVGAAFVRIFEPRDLLPVIVPCALTPVLLSVLCSRPTRAAAEDAAKSTAAEAASAPRVTRPLWPSLVLTVVCWLSAMSATLFRAGAVGGVLPGAGLIRDIGRDLLDAPHAVLGVVAPAAGDARLLVLPAACVWLAAFAGAELALRTRTVVVPALPALVLFAVPVVLGVGGPGDNVAASMFLIGSIGLLLSSRRPGRGSSLRNLSVGVPLVLACALFAGLVGPALPGADRRAAPDLHRLVDPPVDLRVSGASPLDRISAWLQTPERPLFTVAGPAPADRTWRLAVFDTYDGVRWAPSVDLRPTTGRIPDEADTHAVAKLRESHQVTIRELGGIWLPTADRPSEVNPAGGPEISVDPGSGAVIAHRRLTPGTRYAFDARIPVPDPNRLQFLRVGANPADIALPERDAGGEPFAALPVFRRLAEEATVGSSFPYQQALRLATWLRTNYRYDTTATPGHSYRNLQYFLESGKVGTSEQFATAFAVMARSLGLPARVVVGFSAGTDVGGGVREVRAGDVIAWPEVQFAGAGWVPFSPTPGRRGESGERERAPGQDVAQPGTPASAPPARVSREQADAGIEGTEHRAAPDDRAKHSGSGTDAGFAWWILPAAIGALLVLGYLAAGAAVPYVERRRRRAKPADERLLAAWQSIGGELGRAAGVPAASASTAREIAVLGGVLLPEEVGTRLSALADLVNDCAYGDRVATDAEANDAWELWAVVAGSVRREVSAASRRRRALARWRPGTVIAVWGFSKGRRAWGQ
ncbi:DUF3488 and transglutaminase-like domain-containing protein [Embleya sp. MST-111070]|uniref:DUF3488 and transglutaminase-like domain-containing protein n=1 Tax=Embleya sp. MST-111070 TaxID=3398231 RepID=UPI003F738DA1